MTAGAAPRVPYWFALGEAMRPIPEDQNVKLLWQRLAAGKTK